MDRNTPNLHTMSSLLGLEVAGLDASHPDFWTESCFFCAIPNFSSSKGTQWEEEDTRGEVEFFISSQLWLGPLVTFSNLRGRDKLSPAPSPHSLPHDQWRNLFPLICQVLKLDLHFTKVILSSITVDCLISFIFSCILEVRTAII